MKAIRSMTMEEEPGPTLISAAVARQPLILKSDSILHSKSLEAATVLLKALVTAPLHSHTAQVIKAVTYRNRILKPGEHLIA